MCNITFVVPGLSTFVFKKSSEKKNISLLYLWSGAQRVLVGIMLAQRRRRWPTIISQLGQLYRAIGAAAFREIKRQRKHGAMGLHRKYIISHYI